MEKAPKGFPYARVKGLEPSAYSVTGNRSNQLSYTRIIFQAQGPEWLFLIFLAFEVNTSTRPEQYDT